MICNICNNEIVEEISLCPFCGAELEIEESNFSEWINFYTTNSMIEAEMLKSQLLSAGFPVEILSQFDSMRMLTVGDLSIIKLFTPKQYAIEVRNFTTELLNSNYDEQ